MAEDEDKSQKTEPPTAKRLAEAAKKGQSAKSQEINHLFVLSAATFALAFFAPGLASSIARIIRIFFEAPHLIPMGTNHLPDLLGTIGLEILFKLAPTVFLVMVAAVTANLIQAKPVFTAENMKPKLSKVSPISGAKRLVSPKSLTEFAKGFIKISIVGVVVFIVIWPERNSFTQLMTVPLGEILMFVCKLALRILSVTLMIMVVIALLDFMYQKYEHTKGLRMSKQDIKDENKQTDGDPQVKQRIRTLRMERARQRMMQGVPDADVVITNPTHFAVALQYEAKSMEAPKLIAKGVDALALRIREVAEENGVPVVENPPIARALYASVEVDEEIPDEHYKAVAEIIGYVMKLKGQKAVERFTTPRNRANRAGAAAGA